MGYRSRRFWVIFTSASRSDWERQTVDGLFLCLDFNVKWFARCLYFDVCSCTNVSVLDVRGPVCAVLFCCIVVNVGLLVPFCPYRYLLCELFVRWHVYAYIYLDAPLSTSLQRKLAWEEDIGMAHVFSFFCSFWGFTQNNTVALTFGQFISHAYSQHTHSQTIVYTCSFLLLIVAGSFSLPH